MVSLAQGNATPSCLPLRGDVTGVSHDVERREAQQDMTPRYNGTRIPSLPAGFVLPTNMEI